MTHTRLASGLDLHPAQWELIVDLASERGIPLGRDVVIWDIEAAQVLARLQLAGGRWEPLGPITEWRIGSTMNDARLRAVLRRTRPELLLSLSQPHEAVTDVGGIIEVAWRGQRLLLTTGVTMPRLMGPPQRFVALAGPSCEAILALCRELLAEGWRDRPRLRVWGNQLEVAAPAAVEEDEIVLAADLKRGLLDYLDRFWRLLPRARELGLPTRRGVLLAGNPGTGKTLFVRHLLSRYPEVMGHLFISSRHCFHGENDFEAMLGEIGERGEPAMVVIEDIDHILDSASFTREFLLNSLDGLLELGVPLLWLATSNDPGLLERNLLDRPGRFDRVVVLPAPGPAERRELLRRFAPLGIDEEALRDATARSDGLMGAHLREAGTAATLAVLDTGEPFGAALLAELRRLQEHHERARKLRYELQEEAGAGFR